MARRVVRYFIWRGFFKCRVDKVNFVEKQFDKFKNNILYENQTTKFLISTKNLNLSENQFFYKSFLSLQNFLYKRFKFITKNFKIKLYLKNNKTTLKRSNKSSNPHISPLFIRSFSKFTSFGSALLYLSRFQFDNRQHGTCL